MQLSRPTFVFKPLISPCTHTTASCSWLCLLFSLDALRVLQWNAGGLRARSTEIQDFISLHAVDPICIQESNLNSSSSFQIPGFSALRSDRTHSLSGISSADTTYASGGIIIFVRQCLSFSELSISLFSLDPYSDYVGVNISLNNFSLLSFLSVYVSTIRSSTDSRTDSIFSRYSSRNLFILGHFNYHHPFWDSKGTSDLRGEEVFDWVISSDPLPLNDSDIPTLLHRFSGSGFSPDIFIAPSSLALSCSLEKHQVVGSDHLPILLTVPHSTVFRPYAAPHPSVFRKLVGMTASYIDSNCPSAEEYSSLSSIAALFTSLTLNAAKSSILFGRIKRQPKAWWSAELEEAVSERLRLSSPLIEAMKIARLKSLLPDVLRLLSLKLKLRHG